MTRVDEQAAHDAFEAQRGRLWGLAYRMTGSAVDADDIVQDTFVRLLERPPADTARDLAPWLTRVAMNQARDRLRRRKHAERPYVGPWLPEPAPEAGREDGAATRLELRESAGFAYLLALEALTPLQRGVLLLRDVFAFSAREAADALETSEGSVRTTLHRARKVLRNAATPAADADVERRAEQHRLAIATLLPALFGGDIQTVRDLLAADVSVASDAGGEYSAATRVVTGRDHVARFLLGLASKHAPPTGVREVELNGTPAWFLEYAPSGERIATRQVLLVDVDEVGHVTRFWTVLSTPKLERLVRYLERAPV